MDEDELHRSSQVGRVQWHRMGMWDSSSPHIGRAAEELRRLEEELQVRAAAVLEREGLSDWAVSLHISSTRGGR